MKKILTLFAIVLIAIFIGGLYGILNDQVSYTVSPEYYTKFKFYQFGLAAKGEGELLQFPRFGAAKVGFLATWWMGLIIGIVLGLAGLIQKGYKRMFTVTMQAAILVVSIAFAIGLCGLAYGKFHLAKIGVSWWMPENLVDAENFIAVGSMHNFSYLGGFVGMIAGIVYIVAKRISFIKNQTS